MDRTSPFLLMGPGYLPGWVVRLCGTNALGFVEESWLKRRFFSNAFGRNIIVRSCCFQLPCDHWRVVFLCHQSRVKSLTEPFKEWSWNSTGLNSSHWFPFTTYGKHLSNLRIWDWIISGFQLNTCGTKVVINFKSTCRMYCWVCSAWILTFLKEKLVR